MIFHFIYIAQHINDYCEMKEIFERKTNPNLNGN